MERKFYKTVDSKGRLYIPSALREQAGIGREDIVQLTEKSGVLLINKAEINAENPLELIEKDIHKEKEAAEKEKTAVKNRMKQMLVEGHSVDDVFEEVLRFLY